MRKLLCVLLCVAALGLISPTGVLAANITVSLDGEVIDLGGAEPVLVQGRVLVPLRSIFEKMDAQVNWNSSLKQVEVQKGSNRVRLPLQGQEAYINGVAYGIDLLPRLEGGRTLVPLRFISQALGANVDWDKEKLHVTVNTGVNFKPKEVWGYYVDYNSYTSLANNLSRVSGILPFSYKLGPEGQVVESVYFPQGYSLARKNDMPVYGLIFADDQDLLSKALGSIESRKALAEQVYDIALSRGYQGMNLDFERIKAADRENYTLFVEELANKLHKADLSLTLSVPAKEHDQFSWTKGYDYAALGKAADKLIIMAYDQHYSGSDSGPVAGLRWVERVVKYATSQVDNKKLILGIGLYGYDWPAGQKGRTLDLAQVKQITGGQENWSQNDYVPYIVYTAQDGVRHEVWFENQQSIRGKLELVKKYNLAGIALWRLGIVPAEVWEAIAEGGRG